MQDSGEEASAADEPSVEERSAADTQALQTIKEEGEEEDMQHPAETSKDAVLAQQLAAELEGGAYAQVLRPLLFLHNHILTYTRLLAEDTIHWTLAFILSLCVYDIGAQH